MLTITLLLIHSQHHLLFTRRSFFLPLDFSSPRPLYDLVPSPPAVSAAVAKAKGRKQSLPKHTLFTIIPLPNLLFWHLILGLGTCRCKHLRVIILDEEDDNGDGGTSSDDVYFHCQDGICYSPADLLSTFSL